MAADRVTEREAREAWLVVDDGLTACNYGVVDSALAKLNRYITQSSARIAELEAQVAARADWVCPETYALTLQAVHVECERANEAERQRDEALDALQRFAED